MKMQNLIHKIENFVYRHMLGKKLIALIMVFATMIGFIPFYPSTTFAEDPALPVLDPVIWNYPSQFVNDDPQILEYPLEDLEWSEPLSIIHSQYDTFALAYTAATSNGFNGYSTPEHVVFSDNTVRFLGYGEAQYMDRVYTEEYVGGFETISVTMRPVVMNFHTFSESGLLFNGAFDGEYYTGYALILQCGNMEGMINGGTATLSLYYINYEKMDGNNYIPGSLVTTRTLIGTYKTGINNLSTPAYKIRVDNTAAGGFEVYLDEQMVADVQKPKSGGDGFGFFTGYYGHCCTILSVVEFEQVTATVNLGPVETNPYVKFVDIETGDEIAVSQTVPMNTSKSYVGDTYKVTPPAIDGYSYVKSSRTPLNAIRYRRTGNEIILYYCWSTNPEKSASVDNVQDNGTPDSPVSVDVGDIINYTIDVPNPGNTRTVSASEEITNLDIVKVWNNHATTFVQTANGDIYCWGGSMALPLTNDRSKPNKHPSFSALGIVDMWLSPVSDGSGHANFARTATGDIYVWGNNGGGGSGNCLGLGATTTTGLTFALNTTATNFGIDQIWNLGGKSIIARNSITGNWYVWGDNSFGQLARGNTTHLAVPTLNNVIKSCGIDEIMATSYNSAIGRNSVTGDFYVWGRNSYGELGIGTTTVENSPVVNNTLKSLGIDKIWGFSKGFLACNSTTGEYYVWGDREILGLGSSAPTPQTTPIKNNTLSGMDIVEVYPGLQHCFVKTGNGTIYCWGYQASDSRFGNGSNSLSYSPTIISYLTSLRVTDIWPGEYHGLAKAANGDYYVWGADQTANTSVYNLGLGINTTGYYYMTIPTRQYNLKGMDVVDIWTGSYYTIVKASNGYFYAWGRNNSGQLGVGYSYNFCASPYVNYYLSDLDQQYGIAQIWTGSDYVIALTKNGDYYVWGNNANGRLGLGNASTGPNKPTLNPKFKELGITNFWLGSDYVIGQAGDGKFYVWGNNANGRLGLGNTTTGPTTPTENPTLKSLGVTDIWMGNDYTIAKAAGGYYVWGTNTNGQLGLGNNTAGPTTPTKNNNLSNMTSIWTGTDFVIARTADGDYYVWGNNANGRLGLGNTTTGPTAPTENPQFKTLLFTNLWMGSDYTIACTRDGDYYTWGNAMVASTAPIINTTLSNLEKTDTVTRIWTGNDFNIALTAKSELYCWGKNDFGQVGQGSTSAYAGALTAATKHDGMRFATTKFSITDLLPAGLSLIKSGDDPVYDIYDEEGNAVDLGTLTVSTDRDSARDRITFEFTRLPSGTITFSFSARVISEGYFENTGQFVDPQFRVMPTNPTYHSTETYIIVTEKYQKWNNAFGDTLKGNTFRKFGSSIQETSYSPYQSTMRSITDADGVVWRYYAYQRIGVDSQPVVGVPPTGLDANHVGTDPQHYWCWKDVDDNHDIIFFFVKGIDVIVDYKDNDNRTSGNIKTRYSENVDAFADYYLSMTHMNPFDVWNYAGYYSLDGGTTVEEGVPPVPAFNATEMTDAKHIVLYFTKNPAILVQYREYRSILQDRQNSQLLFYEDVNMETFTVTKGADFDVMTQTNVATAIASGVENMVRKTYKIYKGWSDDNGETVHMNENPPLVENIQTNKRIILYFSTGYIITEQFHEYVADPHSGQTIYELLPDIFTTVFGGNTFTGDPPDEIFDGTNRWEYVGYRIGTEQSHPALLTDPDYVSPVIPFIAGDVVVIYLYKKVEVSNKITVVERFREKDNTGNILKDDLSTSIENAAFLGIWPNSITATNEQAETIKYGYWGYQIDSDEPVPGPFLGIVPCDSPHTVTYLYVAGLTPQVPMLHIRQIVVDYDPNSEVPLPDKGYFTLTDDNDMLSGTCNSGVDGLYVTDFTTYMMSDIDVSYMILGIMPQNYKYLGYLATTSNGLAHDPDNMLTGSSITITYNASADEYYVTVYITPRGSGGDHDDSSIINNVGKIMSTK